MFACYEVPLRMPEVQLGFALQQARVYCCVVPSHPEAQGG
jgi:hypothetical protein